eukprot:TRINITY_DN1570_c0_g2_i3.p1 TRINITY_DN1570_c0_g2~~TRINITY_DN1570_c0_g2_i3.p1  ORF type:complete len:1700 (+),score=513.80 TRINITY_DN1570_c0_g2_i3:421-5100(+)
MAYLSLEKKVDELTTKLSDKEKEVVQLSSDKTVQSQKITLLTLKCEEKTAEVEQKESDIHKLQRTLNGANRDLADRQQELDSTRSRMKDLQEELEQQTRDAEKATSDLQQFKNKTFEQIEEQQQVIEDAHKKAGAAETALQEEKKATAHLFSQVSKLEMISEERLLENDRLKEDLLRAHAELEDLRKIEENLNIEVSDLRLVNSKQDQKLNELSEKLLGNERGLASERKEMNSVADIIQVYTQRLRDANNDIHQLCKGGERIVNSEEEDLLLSDEVDRLEELAEVIRTLVGDVEMQREEARIRKAIEDDAQQGIDDIINNSIHELNNLLSKHVAEEVSERNNRAILELQLQEADARNTILNDQLYAFSNDIVAPYQTSTKDILDGHISSEKSLLDDINALNLQFEELSARNDISSQQEKDFSDLIAHPTGQKLKEAHEKEVKAQNEILNQLTTCELEAEEVAARGEAANDESFERNAILADMNNNLKNMLSSREGSLDKLAIELDEYAARSDIEGTESRELADLLSLQHNDVRNQFLQSITDNKNTNNLQEEEANKRNDISNQQAAEFENLIAAPEHLELQKLLSEKAASEQKLLQDISQLELSEQESIARKQIELEEEEDLKKSILHPLLEGLQQMVADRVAATGNQKEQQQLIDEELDARNGISDLQGAEFNELGKQASDSMRDLLTSKSRSLSDELQISNLMAEEAAARREIESAAQLDSDSLIGNPLVTELTDMLERHKGSENSLNDQLAAAQLMAEEAAARQEIENGAQEDFNSFIGNPLVSDLTDMLGSHAEAEKSLGDQLALAQLAQQESEARNALQQEEDAEFGSAIRFPGNEGLSKIADAKDAKHELQHQEAIERAKISNEEDMAFADEILRPTKSLIEEMFLRSTLENSEQPIRRDIENDEIAALNNILSSAASQKKDLLELEAATARRNNSLLKELEEEEEKNRQAICTEAQFSTTALLHHLATELVGRNNISKSEELEFGDIETQKRMDECEINISKLESEEEAKRNEIIELQQHTWDTTSSGIKMLNAHVGMFVVSNSLMDLMSEETARRQDIEDDEKDNKWELLKDELIADLHRTAEKRAEDYAGAKVEAGELSDALDKLNIAHRKLCDESNMTEAVLRCELKEARGRQMIQSEENAEFRYIATQIENSATELKESSEEHVRIISDKISEARDDEARQRDIIQCHEIYEFGELLMLREPRERATHKLEERSSRTPLDLINKLLLLLHGNQMQFEQQLADNKKKYEKEIFDALTEEEKTGRQDIKDFEESEWKQLLRTSSYSTSDVSHKVRHRHSGERSDLYKLEEASRRDILQQEEENFHNILHQYHNMRAPILQNDETHQRADITSKALSDIGNMFDDFDSRRSDIERSQQRKSRQLRGINEDEAFEREELTSTEETEWELLMGDIIDSALMAAEKERKRARAEEEERRQLAIMREKERLAKEAARTKVTAYMGLEISEGIIVGRTAEYAGERITRDGEVMDIEGVKVFDVSVGGPAYEAGIEPEDLVTHYNGKPVSTLMEFKACSRKSKPGDDVCSLFTLKLR